MADNVYNNGGTTIGTSGSDTIVALNSSGSTLDGMAGTDHLNGGSGNDFIQGGSGSDYLYGGAGNDTFYWLHNDVHNGDADWVLDFQGAGVAGGDTLVFKGFSASDMVLTHTLQGTNGAMIYQYSLTDTHTGQVQQVNVISTNGHALTAQDMAFYA